MTGTVTAGIIEFADAVAALDPDAGRRVIGRLLDEGADPVAVIDDVVVPSQHQVGLRWQTGEWTVAQQHAATEVALAGASEIERRLPPRRRSHGHVVLACAEREWHALTIRLIGLAMRSAGWDTTVLGGGVSALRLGRALHELGPDAAAISCSVLSGLPTSRRFIETAAAAGVPTIVGGAAFGSDARRAEALGATAWASSARGAVHALAGLPLIVPVVPALPRDVVSEELALQARFVLLHQEIAAVWRPFGELGPVAPDTPAEVVSDCVQQALSAVLAALVTSDPGAVSQTRWWISDVLQARGDHAADLHVNQLGERLRTWLREYPRSFAVLDAGWR